MVLEVFEELWKFAGMQQRARLKALDRFKANENAVLVASDVAARGLDITVCWKQDRNRLAL